MTRPVLQRLLAAALLAPLCAATLAVERGQPAPDVRLAGLQGPVALAQARGKVVYLDFWASWCGPCKQSFPWMNEMQKKYGTRGLHVIAVNVDAKRDDAERFLRDNPADFTVGFDPAGDTPRRYAVKGMPTSVLIGPDGTVLQQHGGFREDERAQLEAAIVEALGRLTR
jgi:cytochrome c biogenesis protein CcmG/thiol:disulfide interchange protein DsbE